MLVLDEVLVGRGVVPAFEAVDEWADVAVGAILEEMEVGWTTAGFTRLGGGTYTMLESKEITSFLGMGGERSFAYIDCLFGFRKAIWNGFRNRFWDATCFYIHLPLCSAVRARLGEYGAAS